MKLIPMAKLFSQRYGYTKISDIIIRERMTDEIQNAICNCYDWFEKESIYLYQRSDAYVKMEEELWSHFLNKRVSDFYQRGSHYIVFTNYIQDKVAWFRKLDIIEFSLHYLMEASIGHGAFRKLVLDLIIKLNSEFSRLNLGYRIIDNQIVEITSEVEINSIEQALTDNQDSVREHLSNAMALCSIKPVGDYRNSIKESISAVEALCRKKTNEETLGKALNSLELNGIVIPKLLKSAFDKLYAYTNQENTGIRHALMDEEGTYTPTADEAVFMLVSCSAFINYLNKK